MAVSSFVASKKVRKYAVVLVACVAIFCCAAALKVFFSSVPSARSCHRNIRTLEDVHCAEQRPGTGRALRQSASSAALQIRQRNHAGHVRAVCERHTQLSNLSKHGFRRNMETDFQRNRSGKRMGVALATRIVRAAAGDRKYAGGYDSVRREFYPFRLVQVEARSL